MKFAIGDKVIHKSSVRAHTNYPVDIVVGFLGDAVLTMGWGDGFGSEIRHYDFYEDVKPGDRSWRSAVSRYLESELFTPEEVVVELKKLEDTKSRLEAEFEGVRSQVQEKMEAAAALVAEASELVKPTGKDFFNLVNECKDLYRALSKGGWSHSTMTCKFGR
jgi:hypothetical protein